MNNIDICHGQELSKFTILDLEESIKQIDEKIQDFKNSNLFDQEDVEFLELVDKIQATLKRTIELSKKLYNE